MTKKFELLPNDTTVSWDGRTLFRIRALVAIGLTLLLAAAGYSEGNFRGARLRRIVDENGNGLIVPYFDGFQVADDGTQLVVGGDGSCVPSGQTEGTSEEAGRAYCPNCEEAYDSESSGSWVEDRGEEWCDDCCGNHTTVCDHDGNRYSDRNTDFHAVHETVRYWDGRTGVHTSTVADSNLDDFGSAYVDDRDEYWKAGETFYCDDTCQIWHCDDAYLWDGEQISTGGAQQRMAAAKVDEAPVMHLYHRNVWLKHRLPASHVCDPDEHLALAA